MRRAVGTATTVIVLLLAAGWFVALRPTALGGAAAYIMVKGSSMEPSMGDGDLVITRRRADYDVGDVIAYRVRQRETSPTIIHRIRSSTSAGLVMRGDNNEFDDQWKPQAADVVGAEWVRIPGAGRRLEAARSFVASPIGMAAIVGAVTFLIVVGWGGILTGPRGAEASR